MAALAMASTASAVNIETVPIGNLSNAGELSGESAGGFGPDGLCGAVDYEYRIGKYEVTAGQYTEFLNAVAATDTYGLYNPDMMSMDPGTLSYGCQIQRNGSPGSYTYCVAAEWANRPVNYVSWGDAARFANWLHNGQPTGAQDLTTTEDGAYFLDGATDYMALKSVSREVDWRWAIPSEDEWYKAAYYNPAADSYYDYPTGSDTLPSHDLIDPDSGNNATFRVGDSYTIGEPYYRTEVGAHENSDSPYGTFDQGGNVMEWNEALPLGEMVPLRGLRGGSLGDFGGSLRASERGFGDPGGENTYIGFRVAAVPEPGSVAILALGAAGVLRRRKTLQ